MLYNQQKASTNTGLQPGNNQQRPIALVYNLGQLQLGGSRSCLAMRDRLNSDLFVAALLGAAASQLFVWCKGSRPSSVPFICGQKAEEPQGGHIGFEQERLTGSESAQVCGLADYRYPHMPADNTCPCAESAPIL
jgi:hypothetical protein